MILFQRVFKVHIPRIQSMLLVAGMVLWCLLLSLLVGRLGIALAKRSE